MLWLNWRMTKLKAKRKCSPVHGFPVRYKSRRKIFDFRLSMLVNSPMKFNVRSSFSNDSHPLKFSILSTLFIARFRYSSFFNLWRFSDSVNCIISYQSVHRMLAVRNDSRQNKIEKKMLKKIESMKKFHSKYKFDLFHRFSRLNSIEAIKSSAHDTNPECVQFSRCSPDEVKSLRDWRWAVHCARTFCGSILRWLERKSN